MSALNSEGITFKKPIQGVATTSRRKRIGGQKRKCDLNSGDTINLTILRTFEGPSHSIQRRLDLSSKYLNTLENHLSDVQGKYNRELDKNLKEFVDHGFRRIDEDDGVVPVGILESGLSLTENAAMFNYIQNQLPNFVDPAIQKLFVARVQAGACSSVKTVFQKICGQIISRQEYETSVAEANDDDNDETASPVKNVTKRDKNFSLYDLKISLLTEQLKYKIIILVEDADNFTNTIITQLFTMIGCSNFPAVFIFGVTHAQFISNSVPTNSSTEFIIEKFYSVSPKERLNDFMKRVLLDCKNPFKISGPIASYLESHCEENNFSIESVYQSIKFCLRHHLLTGKAAFCSLDAAGLYSETELNDFMEAFSGIENKNSPRKLQKGKKPSVDAIELLKEFQNAVEGWNVCLRLFCHINLKLRERPLGHTYARMYNSCSSSLIQDDVEEHSLLNIFFRTLTNISRFDFECLLTDCIQLLKDKRIMPDSSLVSSITTKFVKLLTSLAEGEKQVHKGNSDAEIKDVTTKLRRKNQTMAELKQSLAELKRQNDGTSVIHSIRSELLDYLKVLLKNCGKQIRSHNFAEIFLFDDLNTLINAMFPASFLQLNEDVTNPWICLQCSCCSSLDSMSMNNSLPDACIIHRLISEHTTRKVDLNLIFQAFVSIVQIEQPRKKSKSSSLEIENASYLIRFRKAVGELQHMGFIKRSKSKPDEIGRLSWW